MENWKNGNKNDKLQFKLKFQFHFCLFFILIFNKISIISIYSIRLKLDKKKNKNLRIYVGLALHR